MNLKIKNILTKFIFETKFRFISLFQKEIWAKKLFALFVMLIVIFVLHFSLYSHFKSLLENGTIKINETIIGDENNFMSIRCTLNPGVAFSIFESKNPVFVYMIQILSVLIISIFFVLIKDWHFSLPLSGLMFGGLANIIDRSIPIKVGENIYSHSVLDYFSINWSFLFFPKSIFNIADIFVVTSIVIIIIMVIIKISIYFIGNKKNNIQKFGKDD